MSSFFTSRNGKFKIQPSVTEYIEILSAVNQRSLELESLQLARRHNSHESHIVSEQVNSLLAKQAGIQTKINSFSKKSEYHMSYWVNVLHKHQFFRLNLLMFLHHAHQYQKKLSQLDEMKLSLLQASLNETCSVDNFLIILR